MPRRNRRPDLNKLNPFDPADMVVIDAEWRKMNARRNRRRRAVHGWVRVVAVCITYLALAWLIIGLVWVIAIILLAYFG